MDPLNGELHNPKCAAMHIAPWMIETQWFNSALAQIKAGAWKPMAASGVSSGGGDPLYALDTAGVAHIGLSGPIMKGDSKYGGANSIRVRQAIRSAVSNPDVAGIMLNIDSPGGTVAGTAELAADIRAAAAKKPVYAHAQDLIASAAYWIGSAASRLTASPMTEVGSIGTVAVVHDTSGAARADGVEVLVFSTGPMKGAFTDGAPVTDAQKAYIQSRVDAMNAFFLKDVRVQRRLSEDQMTAVSGPEASGKVWLAAEAQKLGLIDGVETIDAAYSALTGEIASRKQAEQTRANRFRQKVRLSANSENSQINS